MPSFSLPLSSLDPAVLSAHEATGLWMSQAQFVLAEIQARGQGPDTPSKLDPVWRQAKTIQERWCAAGLPVLEAPREPGLAKYLPTLIQHNIIDKIFLLRARDADASRWDDVLEWSVHAGWSPWAPDQEGESSIMHLLNLGPNMDVALFHRFDRQGVNWERSVGDKPEGLLCAASNILPSYEGDSLLVQAVGRWNTFSKNSMEPIVDFLINRLEDPWKPIQGDASLVEICAHENATRLTEMLNERWFRERAISRSAATPALPLNSSGSVRSRHRP